MTSTTKSKEQLFHELSGLRNQIVEFKKSEEEFKRMEEELNKHREKLEELINERTLELKDINKKLQQEIIERNRVYEMLMGILDSMRDHVIIIDEHYIILWSNKTDKMFFGEDHVGKKCYVAHHGRKNRCENCSVARTFKDSQVYEHETEMNDPKGFSRLYFWCISAVAERYPDGRAKTVLEISRDISSRKLTEIALRKSEEELQDKSHSLEEMNAALKVLLGQREEDRRDLEENILNNIKQLVMPCLENLKMHHLTEKQRLNIDVLETNLKEIVSPFLRKLSTHNIHFTPRELEIINLIKTGKTTKEIAMLLNVGKGAIDLHRNHIRKKLNLNKKKGNLQLYLSSLS